MQIALDPASGVPVYRQIVDQVGRLIAAGQLQPGQRLDSVRLLAGRLGVNPMTVSKAYALLAARQVVQSRRGRGVFVAEAAGRRPLSVPRELMGRLLDQVVAEAGALGVSADWTVEALRDRFSRSAATRPAERPAGRARPPESPVPADSDQPEDRPVDRPAVPPAASGPDEDVSLL